MHVGPQLRLVTTMARNGETLDAVIVGLGRAGAGLHIPILHKLPKSGTPTRFGKVVALVDLDPKKISKAHNRLVDDYDYSPSGITHAQSVTELEAVDKATTVVHVCTPASDHLPSLRNAADAGFRRFIIEKPCASTVSEVDEMRTIAEEQSLTILVVNPYLHSRSLEICGSFLQESQSPMRYLDFEMSKPRKGPTVANRSTPESVLDVELPHAIAAALHITRPHRYEVLRADVRHMHFREREDEPCKIIYHMGLGIVVLQLDQCIATLVSYLDAPTRIRRLRLRLADSSEAIALFPVTEDDHTAVVDIYAAPGSDGFTTHKSQEKYPDDLFTSCLSRIYSRLSERPGDASDLEFNRKVIDIMDKSKARVGIRVT